MKGLAIILASAFFLVGCEDQGPLERAGEEVDEAFENVRNGGETLPNRIDDVGDELRNAGEELVE